MDTLESDIAALKAKLEKRDVAAFIVEPVQGKGVQYPRDDFYAQAQKLCRDTGTLFVALLDEGLEIITGLWRGQPYAFAGQIGRAHV